MLYHLLFNVEYPATMSQKDLFTIWAREVDAALGAKKAGAVVDLWKCVGSRRVIAIGGTRHPRPDPDGSADHAGARAARAHKALRRSGFRSRREEAHPDTIGHEHRPPRGTGGARGSPPRDRKNVNRLCRDAHAARLARSLEDAGIAPGQPGGATPAFPLVYLAVQRVGGIAVSLNPTLTTEEVQYILDDSGARVVFTVGDLVRNIPRGRDAQPWRTSSRARGKPMARRHSATGWRIPRCRVPWCKTPAYTQHHGPTQGGGPSS